MKTVVTIEIETPDNEPVQAYALAIDTACRGLRARGYKARAVSFKPAPLSRAGATLDACDDASGAGKGRS